MWKYFHKFFGTLSFPAYVNAEEKVMCTPWEEFGSRMELPTSFNIK